MRSRTRSGFTLIELVMVIVLIGVLATVSAALIRQPIDASADVQRRARLADAQAAILCKQDGKFRYGTHTVFIGRIEQIHHHGQISPLVYLDGVYTTTAQLAAIELADLAGYQADLDIGGENLEGFLQVDRALAGVEKLDMMNKLNDMRTKAARSSTVIRPRE